jgi:ABC-2 type transport system ATP-binding protein
MSILKLDKVSKFYRNKVAVDNVSFEVPQGEIFGLLGPNGAGKTSLIRIITTITGADTGSINFNGEALNSNHPSEIGYLPEERGLYKKMKVGEQLLYLAQLKGLTLKDARTKILELMDRFESRDWWHKKVEELSKGMQQKIQFIATIVHEPKLIILDEPFSGLDPINTDMIKAEIRRLNENGTTIIFSTHRMEQVEEICQHILLINNGKNVLEGKVDELKERFKQNRFLLEFEGHMPNDIQSDFKIVSDTDHQLIIEAEKGMNANDLLRKLLNRGIVIQSFREILPSLNDIFIHQVKHMNHE